MRKEVFKLDYKLLFPTHLFYEAVGKPVLPEVKKVDTTRCCLCGVETEYGYVYEYKAGRFSDFDIFKVKENIPFTCPACSFTLSHMKELHKMYILSTSSITYLRFEDQKVEQMTLGETKIVSRSYLANFLLNPPKEPWVLMLQNSMNSQHTLPLAKVNYGEGDGYWVSEGRQQFFIEKEGLRALIEALKICKEHGLYACVFSNFEYKDEHKRMIWEQIEPYITPYKNKHYLSFLYDRIVPRKEDTYQFGVITLNTEGK